MGTNKTPASAGELLTEIGERILVERTRQKLKLKDLQEKSGVTSLTISNLEQCKLDNISIGVLLKIADALGMELLIDLK